jgi:hypothetical protein
MNKEEPYLNKEIGQRQSKFKEELMSTRPKFTNKLMKI